MRAARATREVAIMGATEAVRLVAPLAGLRRKSLETLFWFTQ